MAAMMSAGAVVALVSEWPDVETAVATVFASSGGKPDYTGSVGGIAVRGLWALPESAAAPGDATNPVKATAIAYERSSGGTDFNLWPATRISSFDTFRFAARAAIAEAEGKGVVIGQPTTVRTGVEAIPGPIGDAAAAATGFAGGIGDLIKLAGKGLSVLISADFWKRAGFILAGVVLLLLGVVAIFGRDAVAAVNPLTSLAE